MLSIQVRLLCHEALEQVQLPNHLELLPLLQLGRVLLLLSSRILAMPVNKQVHLSALLPRK